MNYLLLTQSLTVNFFLKLNFCAANSLGSRDMEKLLSMTCGK